MKQGLLVALVVLGLVGATATPAATGADTPTQANATDMPPGVSEEGITDPFALTEAHRETLQDTSHTITTMYAYRWPNGTVFSQGFLTQRVSPGAERYTTFTSQTHQNKTQSFDADHFTIRVWANETEAVTARKVPGQNTAYRRTTGPDTPLEPDTEWELLYSAFADTNTTVVGQFERNGTTLYKIVSTSSPEADATDAVAKHDFAALVDSNGVVRSFQTTERTTIKDRPVIVTRTMQVTRIGNTTVEQPAWYQQAVENATK